MPSGYTENCKQTLSIQNGSTATIYQSVNLTAGSHTLSFYASGRAAPYQTTSKFSVSVGDISLASNETVSTENWALYSYSFAFSSTNLYVLSLDVENTASNDSTINFANFTIM